MIKLPIGKLLPLLRHPIERGIQRAIETVVLRFTLKTGYKAFKKSKLRTSYFVCPICGKHKYNTVDKQFGIRQCGSCDFRWDSTDDRKFIIL